MSDFFSLRLRPSTQDLRQPLPLSLPASRSLAVPRIHFTAQSTPFLFLSPSCRFPSLLSHPSSAHHQLKILFPKPIVSLPVLSHTLSLFPVLACCVPRHPGSERLSSSSSSSVAGERTRSQSERGAPTDRVDSCVASLRKELKGRHGSESRSEGGAHREAESVDVSCRTE